MRFSVSVFVDFASLSVLFATYKLAFGHKMPSFWPEAVDAKQNQRITPNKPKGQTLCYQCTKSYAKILSILTIGQLPTLDHIFIFCCSCCSCCCWAKAAENNFAMLGTLANGRKPIEKS